jgi:hypothetical protein
MGVYKHCVPMSIDRVEVVEEHDDYVVMVEWLKPDPKGVYLVMSDYDEPTWAARRFEAPRSSHSAGDRREP